MSFSFIVICAHAGTVRRQHVIYRVVAVLEWLMQVHDERRLRHRRALYSQSPVTLGWVLWRVPRRGGSATGQSVKLGSQRVDPLPYAALADAKLALSPSPGRLKGV